MWSGRLIVGAVAALLALLVIHQGGVRGHVCFAPGFVSFVAPAGRSVATIRAVRTLVELPGLLLRGPVVLAVAVLLIPHRILFVAPANVP